MLIYFDINFYLDSIIVTIVLIFQYVGSFLLFLLKIYITFNLKLSYIQYEHWYQF